MPAEKRSAQRRGSGPRRPINATRRTRLLGQTLQSRLQRAFSGKIWKTRDARAFVEELYASDAFATSEGSTKAWSGREQLEELAKGVMDRFAKIHFCDVSVCALGPGGASQVVVVEVQPRDSRRRSQVFKVLYTWRKTRRGWRIVHDVTAKGGIAPC